VLTLHCDAPILGDFILEKPIIKEGSWRLK
jgi:hypothetical protein